MAGPQLAAILRDAIKEVRIWRRRASDGKVGVKSLYGQIEFVDSGAIPTLNFSDLDLDQKPKLWRQISVFIRAAGRPIRQRELEQRFGKKNTHTWRALRAAALDGAILYRGRCKGWVANPAYSPAPWDTAAKSKAK